MDLCLVGLNVRTKEHDQRDGQSSWLGDLKRVCEKAKVRVHLPVQQLPDCHVCSSLRQDEVTVLGSWPVIPDEEDEGN